MAALERTYKPVVNVSTDFLLSLTEYLPRNPLSLANWLKDGDPHAVTRLMCGSRVVFGGHQLLRPEGAGPTRLTSILALRSASSRPEARHLRGQPSGRAPGLTTEPKEEPGDKPATMTMANGFCESEPIPVESAAGSSPRQATSAVIMIGRSRTSDPSSVALRISFPPDEAY